MTTRFSRRAIACALLATTSLAAPAFAASPTFRQFDENGVDLVQGDVVAQFTEGSIGSGDGRLILMRLLGHVTKAGTKGTSQFDNILFTNQGTSQVVDFGLRSDRFPGAESRGATLSGSDGSWTYTTPDGTVVAFTNNEPGGGDINHQCGSWGSDPSNCTLLPTSITSPDGKVVTLDYGFWEQCWNAHFTDPLDCLATPRLARVTNSFGYSIQFSYAGPEGRSRGQPPATFNQRTGASFFNNNVSTTTPQASVSYAYPSTGVTDVTDIGSRVWRYTDTASTVAVRRPGAASNTTTYSLSTAQSTYGQVTSVTNEGVTTSYSRSTSTFTATMTVTDPLANSRVITSDLTIGRPMSFRDELNRTTNFVFDSSGRLTRTTMPEGNYVQLSYDSRGNVTQERHVAKPGSGLADIVSTASFPATCSNAKTCNKPTSTTDARGNTTDFTYDPTHGGVLTATAPAPSTGAVRPQSRYSYTLTGGVYLMTGVSQCQTTSSCTGTADEAKASAAYDTNGNITSASSGDGTGALTATSTMTYDAMGNLLTVDGPLAGADDTTRYRYDAARELIGTTSPDPDGAGPLKLRATRNTYTNGMLTKVERGTVLSQSDSDWAAFAPAEAVDVTFDANARPVTSKLSAGGTDYALTQTSYDALGRAECSAVRMNPAVYASLPASACSLGTAGSFGNDRITKTIRDAAGQLTQVKVAFGTADEANERTLSYSNNGLLTTLTDAETNKTTYVYDGFDRLSQTQFPSSTKGSGTSNASDYEQLGYDANGNVTSRRLRDGNSIAFTFDALNRVTLKDLPGSEPDVTFGYDNLGRLTSASQTGNALSFTYDALSRNLTQVGPQGTVTSEWDLAGRRTKLTYPGSGLYVNYDYLTTDEVTQVRENGATTGIGVLAAYGYDDLGNRTSVTFGNGAAQAFTYDPVSRLSQLTNNLSGTTNDLTATFTYNPASQITSTVRTGDTYAWTGNGNGSTAFTQNGLNQQITVGGSAASWDSKGNLTSEPQSAKTYGYSSENLLTSASGGLTLSYDPGMRLYQVAGAATTRFAYDGDNAIAEYNASNALQRRFVFAEGVDDPIVQYEGSGTADRRFMGVDERGSIISLTDGSGTVLAINRYDEYGKPQGTNSGRFQYTGQKWISEINGYDYKNRDYFAHLGIFPQTDPIGPQDSPNLYTYVLSDPVNFVDPIGLLCGGPATNGAGGSIVITACQNGPIGGGSIAAPGGGRSERSDAHERDIVITAPRLPRATPQSPSIVPAVASSDPKQPPFCQAEWTPHGDTKGENPRPGRGGYNTDLPGGWKDAIAVFVGLGRLAGDTGLSGGGLNPFIIARSEPSGIQLRWKPTEPGRPRIDIPADTFQLTKPETIHFTGGKGNMCPIR